MGRSAGLFVVDSIVCVRLRVRVRGGGVQHAGFSRLQWGRNYADFRYFQETGYGPSARGGLKETRLFQIGEEGTQAFAGVRRKKE